MKQQSLTYRAISLMLASLILLTSFSFSVDMHFCQGQFVSFGIFSKAKSCHELAAKMQACPFHKNKTTDSLPRAAMGEEDGCCKNETVFVQSELEQCFSADENPIEDNQPSFLTNISIENPIHLENFSINHFQSYKPPLLLRDIPLLIQSFLL